MLPPARRHARLTILVTGGTGVLGREIARAAARSGHVARIGSRGARTDGTPAAHEWAQMDLGTGGGVAAAVAGADLVIHAASDPKRSRTVDVEGTRRLVEAARAAGVSHFVYVSIVGIDRIPLRYYRDKLAAEQIVAAAGVPHSIVRATQFHTFVDRQLRRAARFPLVMALPTAFRVQSAAPSDAADYLLRCAAAGPAGRCPDFGGPEVLTMGEAAAQWQAARSARKPIVALPVPGRVGAAFRAGACTVPDGAHGTVRWGDWLREQSA
jgi:uncharacterized protein YbjT (DUF2867 family)